MLSRLTLGAMLSLTAAAHAESQVGAPIQVGQSALAVLDEARPLAGFVWYPAGAGGMATTIGDSAIFVGVPVQRDAPPGAGVYPLVLLSHGLGGDALNQDWLAAELVRRGVIVAAINHPGTTFQDMRPETLSSIWQRPVDVSRAMTHMLNEKALAAHIDAKHIAVVGHSLGGYTALALAGVRVAGDGMPRYCAEHQNEGCDEIPGGSEALPPADARYSGSNRDLRIAAAVAMAPALSPAMLPDSLAAVSVPVLLIAAVDDHIIPLGHVRGIAGAMPPPTELAELPDAGHFDFLPLCQPGGAAVLRRSGELAICDGAPDRVAVHRAVAARIVAFLRDKGFGMTEP